jgi:hypothetical protein
VNQNHQLSDTAELIKKQKQGRLIMLAIVAVFVLPFFIAPLLKAPDQLQKTNKGILIQPHIPLTALQLVFQGNPFSVTQLQNRWTMLYVIPENCHDECILARDHALYAIRQVRLSLDRNMDRVQQLLVLTQEADSELAKLIEQEFSGMMQVNGKRQILNESLPEDHSPAGNIYLMSPDGYIFMRYPTFADEGESVLRARDIRADLKKTIKGDRRF